MSNLTEMNTELNVVRGSFRRNLIRRMIGKIRVWNQRRQAVRELSAMPDSLLRDLGIERFQISDVVYQTGQFAEMRPLPKVEAVVMPLQKAAA